MCIMIINFTQRVTHDLRQPVGLSDRLSGENSRCPRHGDPVLLFVVVEDSSSLTILRIKGEVNFRTVQARITFSTVAEFLSRHADCNFPVPSSSLYVSR